MARSKAATIERLRRRLQELPEGDPVAEGILDVIKGILDLLADEL